jgi:transcriptional regulator GlxA family with amidase domain
MTQMKSADRKRNVGILVFNDAEVLDFAGPFEVFSVTSQLNDFEPFNVFTISKNTERVLAVNGLQIIPDYSIQNHPPIDVFIISGGQGTKVLLDDTELLSWVYDTYNKSEVTLSICSGARLLAKLGILDDKFFCTHHEVYDHIEKLAPASIPQKDKRFIQTDGRLYTSGGISAGIDLSFHIVEKILGKDVALNTARYMEYDSITVAEMSL